MYFLNTQFSHLGEHVFIQHNHNKDKRKLTKKISLARFKNASGNGILRSKVIRNVCY